MVEVQKLETFYDFCGARATLCGDLREFKGLFTISAVRARVVEVQKLEAFYEF